MTVLDAAKQYGAFAAFVGLLAGIGYGVGGAVVDVATTGWNRGTWLALNAVWAMPFLFLPAGVVAGALWYPVACRLPRPWGNKEPARDIAEAS